MWPLTSFGIYSVKSAYHALHFAKNSVSTNMILSSYDAAKNYGNQYGILRRKKDEIVWRSGERLVKLKKTEAKTEARALEESSGFFELQSIAKMVRDLKEKENLMELVDPRLGSDYGQEEEVMVAINVALRCTNLSSANRPSMSSVVSMLEGRVAAQGLISGSAVSTDDSEALRNLLQQMVEENVSESETPLEGNVLESEISILRQ
ncbi:hypothetical protein FEM48_Zijuj12G0150800 [Ziziphus jujuba var. spinosa]|uniref:Uncharacterized protein n=1 Tax=Ziziphus jujuba var. spinosa TaxID=714518 RepID=A0A978UE15_ZIZJJ|nr:hypothetical protein FEM48_Zijuj12G0150800 [Ziziphus jujuba var. spinosa]